jgi:hypothetical protein
MLHEGDGTHEGGLVRDATLDDGGLLVYDTVSEEAWLQSDTPVNLAEHG